MAFNKAFLISNGVPEDKVENILAERNRTLSDYIPKTDMQAQIDAAVTAAKGSFKPEETEGYKKLQGEFTDYKARQEARSSDAWKGVKPKFFDTVYSAVDKTKDIAPQLEEMRKGYEEYFDVTPETPPVNTPPVNTPPVFSQPPGRAQTNPPAPEAQDAKSFTDALLNGLTGIKRKE